MLIDGFTVAVALGALLSGAGVLFLFLRPLLRRTNEAARRHEARVAELEKELAVEQESARNAASLQEKLTEDLRERERGILDRDAELRSHASANATLKATLAAEHEAAEEKLALLSDAKKTMETQFKTLANEIFDDKRQVFSAQSQEKLTDLLKPFREQLEGFRTRVDEIYSDEGKERASLRTELKRLHELNETLNAEAKNLTRALKGEKKTQGDWGELILETVLERSGLRKGQEYETQRQYRDAEGTPGRPDAVIKLPDGKHVVVDSKVSLVAYEAYCSASGDEEREKALREHVAAVRNHVQELCDRDYDSLEGLRSLDFVLMFIPIEPAFMLALGEDQKLYTDAFRKGVVLVAPTTLLATLRTIEHVWRNEQQSKNAKEIATRGGLLYDKIRGFLESMTKLDAQLEKAREAYDEAWGRLKTGRGNIVSQAEQLRQLGAPVKKRIDDSVLDESELENLTGESFGTPRIPSSGLDEETDAMDVSAPPGLAPDDQYPL